MSSINEGSSMKIVGAVLSLAMASFSAHSATTISDITLLNSQSPGNIWITTGTHHWILGVSDKPSGPLLNDSDTSISGIATGQYWLFADPANLGNLPELQVTLSDGTKLDAVFQVSGINGSGQTWARVSGDSEISLGWASGAVDLVGTYGGRAPNGNNDFYLSTIISATPVPEPHPAALFLLGCATLFLLRQRSFTFARFGRFFARTPSTG